MKVAAFEKVASRSPKAQCFYVSMRTIACISECCGRLARLFATIQRAGFSSLSLLSAVGNHTLATLSRLLIITPILLITPLAAIVCVGCGTCIHFVYRQNPARTIKSSSSSVHETPVVKRVGNDAVATLSTKSISRKRLCSPYLSPSLQSRLDPKGSSPA